MGRRKEGKKRAVPVKRSPAAYLAAKLILQLCLFPFFKLEVSGVQNLPRNSAFILLPKHQRWEDIAAAGKGGEAQQEKAAVR